MKARKIAYGLFFSSLLIGSLAGCGEEDTPIQDGVFSFTVSLESGKTTLEVGDTDNVIITTNGVNERTPIRLGIIIRPLNVSEISHASCASITEPARTSKTKKILYGHTPFFPNKYSTFIFSPLFFNRNLYILAIFSY